MCEARPSVTDSNEGFRRALDSAARESTAQLLFKCARLVNARALASLPSGRGGARVRQAHTALFPHVRVEGTRLTELASAVGVSKQAVGQLVDELVEWGMFERVADPTDARAKLVRWTARGRRGLLEGLATLRSLEDELSLSLGDARWSALRDALLALHDLLEPPSPAVVTPSVPRDRPASAPPPAAGRRTRGAR